MSAKRIADRYAKSLIDLASESGKLDRVLEDINAIAGALRHRDFYLLLKSPIINADKKSRIFHTLFEGKFDDITVGFFDIILRKGRETYLPEISEAFIDQYNEINKITSVQLTTAIPLGDDKLEVIKSKIVESETTFPNIDLKTKVDPNIIGGFVIEFGDKLYDASVAHQLDLLKKKFSKNTYQKGY